MKWLENNPLGIALAAVCGLFLLASTALVMSWTRPVSSGAVTSDAETGEIPADADAATQLGPFGKYRIVNNRPIFNETRRPVVTVDDDGEPVDSENTTVTEAPDVSLTGVVITPEIRLVMLTPAGGGEPVIFHEGLPMNGEYSGWLVSRINPRKVSLESLDGEVIQLGLMVHDEKITEPPKPKRPMPARDADGGEDDESEQVSRAEEIRQRIAERREQLRQEADKEAQDPPSARADYQAAIQAMINSGSSEKEDSDDEE